MTSDKRTFPHLVLREIYEQPSALRQTIDRCTEGGRILAPELQLVDGALRSCRRLIIAASGSSRHAGLAGEIMIEDLSGVAVDVEYASEYSSRSSHTGAGTLVMVISQSGETGDAVAALAEATRRGAVTIGLTNVPGSTIAREAAACLLTRATPELAVPATKSFTAQLCLLHLLALRLAAAQNRMDSAQVRTALDALEAVPESLEASLGGWDSAALEAARRFQQSTAFLFIGRGVHYAIAREGALKLKEISYAHAEGYPAGELLHGPNALVSEASVVVALATCDRRDEDSVGRYQKTLAVLEYVKKHGGKAIVIATEGDGEVAALSDCVIRVPSAPELLLPILEVVPLQLFAYHAAVLRGFDVDHPRNLVKAVLTS
ncbi:MAG TPA: SIS domain-containing protein [Candidatus Acidoferrales bacterium]|nr:SIS domain-containing protein [Candidatus Acidoferrales bacterium]